MLIERELQIHSIVENALDIQPRGEACYAGLAGLSDHDFFLTTKAAGFTYKICGRCGTVRIAEDHRG
jgi:hypothetical protein